MHFRRCLPLAFLFVAPLALAHPGHSETATFAAGFLHPLTGFDHLLAMLAVGLWSANLHRESFSPAQLLLPAAFVLFLLAGIGLGLLGVGLPAVEPMIAASLLVLGVAAGLGRHIPQAAAMVVVAVFALFHGYAHGAELGGVPDAIAGIVLATALLHLTGIALGLHRTVRTAASAAVAAGGVFFLLQLA